MDCTQHISSMVKDEHFCCICFCENGGFTELSECDESGLKYSSKLTICDPKQDWEQSILRLCKSCIHKLNIVYEFLNACWKSESRRIQKLGHLTVHNTVKSVFNCYLCNKTFKEKRFLKSHITRSHLGKQERRGGTFEQHSKENDHAVSLNIQSDPFSCGNNDYVKEESENISQHFEYFNHNKDDEYTSEEEFKAKPKKKKTTKKAEPLTCEYCGKQFNRHQHWSAHIRSRHTFEKPYKCQLCDASFSTSHSLLVHKRNHNNDKPYICSICGKRFVCSGDLFHHNKIHLNKKEYECNICNKRFNTTSILRTHRIVKHTEPHKWKYVCEVCERRFPINSSLTVHLKRHTGIKDHSCHICNKTFFNKSEVTKHILSHSNQKRFHCDICTGKEYKNKEGLNKHLKISHNLGTWKRPKIEQSFLCALCPKKFNFNNKLQRHILTHTGEKPFKCDYCEKKFSDPYYRKSHMRKEHTDKYDSDDMKITQLIPMSIT